MKFYYENMLANQNFTAKNNIVWACDITEIELNRLTRVNLRQSIGAKLFNWGTVELHSHDSKPLVIKRLLNPRAFRDAINDARMTYTTMTAG